MKILLVSDEESPFIWDYFDPEPFKGVELIISCGDLKASYLSFLATMIPAEVVYIHGNHDKNYLRKPPEGCTCIEDMIFSYKGIRILGFGGCKSPRVAPFEFSERAMKRRVARRQFDLFKNRGFDILVTHAPCFGLGDMQDDFHQGFHIFRSLVEKYQPRFHFFGHVHNRYGKNPMIYKLGETTLVNGCGYKIIEY